MKCSECGGVNGHADPFCSKLDLKAALANEVAINRHAKRYRIEWRVEHAPDATVFWEERDGWQPWPEQATVYTEAERCAKELPPHGCWVVLNGHYNPVGALNVHQLAAVGVVIRETFEDKGINLLDAPRGLSPYSVNWIFASVDGGRMYQVSLISIYML